MRKEVYTLSLFYCLYTLSMGKLFSSILFIVSGTGVVSVLILDVIR